MPTEPLTVAPAPEVMAGVEAYYRHWYQPISPHWQSNIATVLSDARAQERLDRIARFTGLSLPGAKLLEIGSGFGVFALACAKRGIECHGVEPEPDVYRTSQKLLGAHGWQERVRCAPGERVPHPDDTFDVVAAFQVMEHVADQLQVLREALRVLKPGGFLYFEIPNYHSFWESHYALFWLPSLSKPVGKWYVKLLGRDPEFLNDVNFVTPASLRQLLKGQPLRVVTWGKELWHERFASDQVPVWGQSRRLVGAASLVKKLGLGRVAAWAGDRMDWYYPITLVAQKHE